MFSFFETTKRLMRDQAGVSAMVFGLLLIPLIGALGLAVDTARGYGVKSMLMQALDASALVGAKNFTATYRNDYIQRYFNENWRDRFNGATISPLSIVANDSTKTIRVTATVTLPTVFMRSAIGMKDFNVSGSVTAVSANTSLELALSVDVSGSMAGTKIAALRDAATDMIDILLPNNITDDRVHISIAPFDSQVTIGTGYTNFVASGASIGGTSVTETGSYTDCGGYTPTVTRVTTTRWDGEFYARTGSNDRTDLNPSAAGFYPVICTTQKFYRADGSLRCTNTSSSCDTYSSYRPRLLPLTSNPVTLKNYIATLTDVGYTATNIGLFWGWMTISPNWQGYWSGVDATLPKSYNITSNVKAAVLMTDGVNTANWAYQSAAPSVPTGVNDRMLEECTAMKNNGILIFTIGFDLDSLSSYDRTMVETMLTSCASTGRFYSASDSNALQTAFTNIANTLSALRLTE